MPRSLVLLALLLPAPLLAADPAHGQQVFHVCAACHGTHGQGTEQAPPLIGIIGRPAAAIEEFRYSPAMKRSGIVWDPASLEAFLVNPQAKVKGTRMPFDGLRNGADAADVVAYIGGLK